MLSRRIAACALAACACVSLAAAPVLADPPAAETKQPTAEELTDSAYGLYNSGDYPGAIASYLKAYQISAATPVLFNIATIYDRKLHERELAADFYRRYLRAIDGDPNLVKRANERLAALEEERQQLQSGTSKAKPSGAGDAEEPSSAGKQFTTQADPGKDWRLAGLVTGGVGIAGIITGAVFGIVAYSQNHTASSECPSNTCTSSGPVSLTNSAQQSATVSTTAFIAGGVLLASGAALFFTHLPSQRVTASVRLSPALGPSSAGLMLGGAW
jgi:hypothetical protein